jgi:predicted HicB family RNase H-like nuclease
VTVVAREPRVQLNLKVPAQLREQLTDAAQAAGVSTNRYCEFALTTYLHFMQETNPPTPARRRA